MRVTELWKEKKAKPTLSFELFPARTEQAAEKLEKVLDNLTALSPDFVSVTFGAGGSTREGSHQLLEKLMKEKNLDVIAYFAGYGLAPDDIVSVLDSYKALGIESVLVVRGDPPHDIEGFTPHPDSFAYATDLLGFVGPRFDFCLGCAGYPEGHIEAVSKEKDLAFLKLKVTNGARYIIANYCYDNQYFFDFVDRCRAAGIDAPIVPGVMPIYSVKMMENLSNLCGATITEEIRTGLAQISLDDKEEVARFGVEFAIKQCRELLEKGVPGVHIYTMNRSKATVEIVSRLRSDGLL
jgi:methylenetetrahydrofolate reductase (NADH)